MSILSLSGKLLTALIVMAALGVAVLAQSAESIAIGETQRGAVTPENIAPTYFFDAREGQTLTIRLNILTPGFTPLALIADSDNALIGSISSAPGLGSVFSILTIRADGQYQVQVQGANDSFGEFEISVLEGSDALTPSPVPTATPDETIPSTPERAAHTLLEINQEVAGLLSRETPSRTYGIPPGQIARTIVLLTDSDSEPPMVTLEIVGTGEVIAVLTPPVFGGTLYLPAGENVYTLRLSLREGDTTSYRLSLRPIAPLNFEQLGGLGALVTNTPVPTATPDFTPTPEPTPTVLAASDVDVILRWNSTQFMMTNVSGDFLDIHDLGFVSPDGRRADANFWDRSGTVDIFAMPPRSCVGLRPLAYPDAPARPADCEDLASWWVSDTVVFWYGETFDVLYNRVPLQTCTVAAGQCMVDLPNA